MMDKKGLKIAIISTVVIAVVIFLVVFLEKQKDKKEIAEILRRINEGEGAAGADIKSLLKDVSADSQFSQADYLANKIKSAKGTIWDTDQDVIDALKGLGKPQIKAVYNAFEGDMDKYLNPDLGGFMNKGNWDKVISMVKNA